MSDTKSSIEGVVGLAKQSAKGTAASAFDVFRHTRFNWTPDVVQDEEPEPELGGTMDVEEPIRYGFRGATFDGELRFRPGHAGHVLRAFGMEDNSGGMIVWTGINDTIYVTDDGGGPTAVNILTGTDMVSGTRYTPTEFAAFLKEALEEQMTGAAIYTVSYSTSTKKWTISHDGSTLSLHHTTAGGKMMSNMLGFNVAADDTGSTTYTGDYERDMAGRFVLTGDNDDLVVTDQNGGPTTVSVLTTRTEVRNQALNGWQLAGALKSALEAQMEGAEVYTVLYDDGAAANKFIISVAGTTLTIPWTNAACTIEDLIGFVTDDSGATSYTADTALVPAKKHSFQVCETAADFPWYSILDKMDEDSTLNTVLRDCRINNVVVTAGENEVLRMTYSGRGLYFYNAAGTETENAEDTSIGTPVTSSGELSFLATEDYPIIDLTMTVAWQEQVESQLASLIPRSIVPGRRSIKGSGRVSLSAEDDGALFKRVYYGSSSGTTPSTTLSDSPLDYRFDSGQALSTTGTTEYYGFRFIMGQGKLLSYPLEKQGDSLEQGQLNFSGYRKTQEWTMILINNEDYDAYA